MIPATAPHVQDQVVQLRRGRATYADIIDATGLSQTTVAKILKRNGMTRRARSEGHGGFAWT